MSPEMTRLEEWAARAAAAKRLKPSATTFGEYLDGCVIRQKFTPSDLDGVPRVKVALVTKNF